MQKINKQIIKIYWSHVKKYKRWFLLAAICTPLSSVLLEVALPYVLSQTVSSLDDSSKVAGLLVFAATVGVAGFVANLIGFRSLIKLEGSAYASLVKECFSSLMKKDNSFFKNHKIGSLTSKYLDFLRSYVSIQDNLIVRTLGFVLSMIIGLTILAKESWPVALIIGGFIVLLVIEIRWITKVRTPARQERKRLRAEVSGSIADSLTNNLIIRSYAGESRENQALRKLADRYGKVFVKDFGLTVTEGSLRWLALVIVQIAAIAVSAQMVSAGTMTLAMAIFVIAYLQRIGSQLFILSDIVNGYDMALIEAQPLAEILETPDKVLDPKKPKTNELKVPTIKLKNVHYYYDDSDTLVLKGINLDIPAGQRVGLVGRSGAGKSTIAQLLLRLSDVTSGAIEVGGYDVRDINQDTLHRFIGYVSQEPLLFHRTLRENVAYSKPDATDEEVVVALKEANAWEFVENLPQGIETVVGERGIKLSGGQRQRVAIARAILKDAPILLLDEATSALDSESEKLIQDSLDVLMMNRTSIVVAHRLSTIAKLDEIVVIDDGRVAERGTHQNLLKKNGIYAKLWHRQSGGFIDSDSDQ